MHRFYLPPEECGGATVTLTDRDAHHARDVLRIRRGETVTVLDGGGEALHCEVQSMERRAVVLKVLTRERKARPACQATLLQAMTKGKAMESIIQKATELGASRIVPLLTERVTVQLDDADELADKAAKLRTVAIESIKQCGTAWLPRIEPPQTLAQFLARGENFELPLVASLRPGSSSPKKYFEAFRREHSRNPASACAWVGPEGDFADAEIDAILKGGALPITLGTFVLRADTAATYCLSVIHYECQT
jgi:16S rRNA (uracil1498-N3)-methyltransferase